MQGKKDRRTEDRSAGEKEEKGLRKGQRKDRGRPFSMYSGRSRPS